MNTFHFFMVSLIVISAIPSSASPYGTIQFNRRTVFSNIHWHDRTSINNEDRNAQMCSGLWVSNCITKGEMISTELSSSKGNSKRRNLATGKRYISYDALKKNNVPCNRKGTSYYNCQSHQKTNPYKRGCSTITHCYRYTD